MQQVKHNQRAQMKYFILLLILSFNTHAKFIYNIQDPVAINHEFTLGIDYEAESKQDALLVTTETHGSPKIGINVTTVGNGTDHTAAIRANLVNNSTSPDGNVAVYANAMSTGYNSWQAAIHGEVRHASGTSIAGNFEVSNYTESGDLYGIVVNNVSLSNNAYHPVTGQPLRPSNNSTAIRVMDDGAQWNTGLHLDGGYKSGNAIDITGNYNISINGSKVLGSAVRGWGHNTIAPAHRQALNELSDLRETILVLNTLIKDLKQHGLISE